MPTTPLAPFPAELGAFEVWAFLKKIGVATTENNVFDPKVSQTAEKIAIGGQKSGKSDAIPGSMRFGATFPWNDFFHFWVG